MFRIRDYRHLFGAQLVALAGNGLATVALGLLAFTLAGDKAAAVLGTALTIKMVAYVLVAPIAGAYAGRFNRRHVLVVLDLARAAVVIALPFADQIWHVYLLVALMQSASAAFTPTFQATLPDILPNEDFYTRALSYSQLASTLETLLSPLLAAILISYINFHWLFVGTAMGFLASASLVVSSRIPDAMASGSYSIADRIFSGVRTFAATPRLRGLMGLNLTVAAIGSIVMVNTVNLVQQHLGRPEADVAWLLTANGAGVLVVALFMPPIKCTPGSPSTIFCPVLSLPRLLATRLPHRRMGRHRSRLHDHLGDPCRPRHDRNDRRQTLLARPRPRTSRAPPPRGHRRPCPHQRRDTNRGRIRPHPPTRHRSTSSSLAHEKPASNRITPATGSPSRATNIRSPRWSRRSTSPAEHGEGLRRSGAASSAPVSGAASTQTIRSPLRSNTPDPCTRRARR